MAVQDTELHAWKNEARVGGMPSSESCPETAGRDGVGRLMAGWISGSTVGIRRCPDRDPQEHPATSCGGCWLDLEGRSGGWHTMCCAVSEDAAHFVKLISQPRRCALVRW